MEAQGDGGDEVTTAELDALSPSQPPISDQPPATMSTKPPGDQEQPEQPLPESDGQLPPDSPIQSPNQPPLSPTMTPNQPILSPNIGLSESQNQDDSPPHSPAAPGPLNMYLSPEKTPAKDEKSPPDFSCDIVGISKLKVETETETEDDIVFTSPRDAKPDIDVKVKNEDDGKVKVEKDVVLKSEKDVKIKTENDVKEEKTRHRKHSSGDSDSHHRKRSTSESESHHRKHSTSESDKGSRERKQSESNDSDSGKHSSKERHGSSRSHHGSSSKRNSSSSESPVKKHRHNSSSDHPRQTPLSPDHKVAFAKHPSQPPPPTGRKGYDVGDLVWARIAGASYHPAIVTKDPHYKFHTKIVKAEVGTTNLDPETRKPVLSPDALEPARQYHIQFLGDNKRMWLTGKLMLAYKGITHYENLAISDVKNIKLYRPKTEAMKSHWRDAVLIAKHLETLETKERIRKCDHSRLSDIGDKALQRKMEYDAQVDKQKTIEKEKEHVKQEKIKSPKIPKIPMKSPIQELMNKNKKDHLDREKEEKEKRKSEHYRRKEEMDYKMHRISSASDRERLEKERKEKEKKERSKEKRAKEKAEKRKHESRSSDTKPPSESNPNQTEADNASNTTTDPKHITTLHGPGEDNKVKIGNGDINNDRNNEEQADSDNGENGKEDKSSPNRQGNGGRGSKPTSEIETETIADGLGEGVLVWAKMRGYPYWPSVVTRDPNDGEFVKANDGFYKIQKKIHVLFLEYQNQRAWVATPSVVKYEGKEKFEEDKKKASASKKKDYICGKRYEESFAKAVDYAEEIRGLSDAERKENVLLKYGWSMVNHDDSEEESDKDSPQKKRKLSEKVIASTVERMEENSEEETKPESVAEETESSGKVMKPDRRKSKSKSVDSRRSSADVQPASNSSSIEAANRLDPGTDSPEDKPADTVDLKEERDEKENGTASEDAVSDNEVMPSPARRKRVSSQIAAVAMDVNKSSDSDSDDEMDLPKTMKIEKKITTPAKKTPTVTETPPSLGAVTDQHGFPQLGDLVWGRMSGFPYWPAFVTRSPQGLYRKAGKLPGKFMFHVQFFNWNDESGWCNSALEFDGLDQFKKIAAKHKKDKSYNPTKGAMEKKWTQAAEDAEQTLGLSRQERMEEFLVNYNIGAEKITPAKKLSSPKPTTSSSASKTPKTEKKTPVAKKLSAKKEIPKRAPMYKALSASGGNTNSDEEPLPPGWRIEKTSHGGALIQTFISPDNKKFSDKEAALRHIRSTKTGNRVENKTTDFEDNNLPEGWRCTRVQKVTANSATSDIFYWSPKGERFRTRKDVAEHLLDEGYSQSEVNKFWQGRRPAPKSVLRSRGFDVSDAELNSNSNMEHDSSTSEDEDETILRLPNGLKWRRGGTNDANLDLGKIFDPSNGGIIEMVQLPDIFLDHPTVSVTESDNEMVISDVDTGEFIAKKIIYD